MASESSRSFLLPATSDTWPTPVRELVRRAAETVSALERHLCLYLALEASIRLGAAARRFEIKNQRDFDRPSAGTWGMSLALAIGRAVSAGVTPFDRTLLGDSAVLAAVLHFNPGVSIGDAVALPTLLQSIATYRNTQAHGSVLLSEAYEEGARHFAVLLEKGWASGLFLPLGSRLEVRNLADDGGLRELVLEREGAAQHSLAPWVLETATGERLFFNNRQNGTATYLDYVDADMVRTSALGAAGKTIDDRIESLLGAADTDHLQPVTGSARYEPLWPIGNGGMGELLLALDLERSTRVVLKRPLACVQGGAELRRRLDRETTLLESLLGKEIPGVVGYLDRFEDARGPVLVMEYVAGCTLERFGRGLDAGESPDGVLSRHVAHHACPPMLPGPSTRRPREDGPGWPLGATRTHLALLRDSARALARVHAAGVLHNDLTPVNIMVRKSQGGVSPVLIDFGLAKVVDGSTRLTAVGGTGQFIAPEAHEGRVSIRSDVYSFGAILRTELAPQDSRSRRLAGLTRAQRVRLARLAERCMQPEPSRRPEGAGAIVEELSAILEGKGSNMSTPVLGSIAAVVAMTTVALASGKCTDAFAVDQKPSAVELAPTAPATPAPTTSSIVPSASRSADPTNSVTASASPVSENCNTWLAAGRDKNFAGKFGGDMNDLAKRIAERKLSGNFPNDFEATPDTLPCAESEDAWKLFVVAAKESMSGWGNNVKVRMSPKLRSALEEAHRADGWPDAARGRLIRDHAKELTKQTGSQKEAEYAKDACRFARALQVDPGECSNVIGRATPAK